MRSADGVLWQASELSGNPQVGAKSLSACNFLAHCGFRYVLARPSHFCSAVALPRKAGALSTWLPALASREQLAYWRLNSLGRAAGGLGFSTAPPSAVISG